VYLCTHLETGEQRAVKIVKKKADQAQNDMVIREFEVLKQLDHPNALKIYALYETDTQFFIVTELIEGGELYELLESEFQEEDVREILRSILGCMNYCHKQNVVHRDLKPENVLLEKSADYSQLKVIDFGLAEFFGGDGSDRFTEGVGSSYYMSPQVIQGNYSYKCDIWSCGVIAFVCLGGYAPYSGEDENETAQIILDSKDDGGVFFDDPVWDAFSDEALDFINYLMTYEEEDRPTAEEALKHPWLNMELSMEDKTEKRMSARDSLATLRAFQGAGSKLKQCTYSLIASQILKKEQKEQFQQLFRNLDVNADGQICEQDLITVYKEQFDLELTEDAAVKMICEVNLSASGAISYSEFVIANMLEKGLVCERYLEAAFQIMDDNKSGYLCFENLKGVLGVGDDMEDYVNQKIIGPADLDDDGKLSLEDFKSFFIEDTEPCLRSAATRSRVGPGSFRSSCRTSATRPNLRSSVGRSSVRKIFRSSANSDDGNSLQSCAGMGNKIASPALLKTLAKEKSFRSLMSVFETKNHNVPSMFRRLNSKGA
jgi:calcium-dependent protein kinase